jgi:hypothetical protein
MESLYQKKQEFSVDMILAKRAGKCNNYPIWYGGREGFGRRSLGRNWLQ